LQEDPAAASTAVGLHPAQDSLHHPCQGNSEVVPLQIAELHKNDQPFSFGPLLRKPHRI
jgi:hypothetical protein